MDTPTIMIPLSTVVAVVGPIIGALVTAVVTLALWGREESRGRLLDAANASKALRESEQGRLEDQRAFNKVLAEIQERVLPLVERAAMVMKDLSDRMARKRSLEDSEPPSRVSTSGLEVSLIRLPRTEDEISEFRRSYPELCSPQGVRR